MNYQDYEQTTVAGVSVLRGPDALATDVENDRKFCFLLLVDSSSSMRPHTAAMNSALREFVDAIVDAEEDDAMFVAMLDFNSNHTFHGFQHVLSLPIDYQPTAMTHLYDAMVVGVDCLQAMIKKLEDEGILANGAMIVLSDGDDQGSTKGLADARAARESLGEIPSGFMAFGDGAKGIAEQLGYGPNDILETDASASSLRKFLLIASKSAVNMSQSAASAKASDGIFADAKSDAFDI